MLRSLYSKLAAVLAGLFFIVGLLFVAVTVFSTGMYQQEVNQKLNSKLAEQIVAEKLLMKDNRVNQEALEEIFHMLMVINPGIEIYLLDQEGNILAFSAPKGKVKRKRVDLKPVRKWLEGDMTIPLLGDDPRGYNRKKVFTAARIPEQGKLEGYLYVILGGELFDSTVQKLKGSYILQLSAWMITASLLFALVAGLILFALLTRRLKRLSHVVGAFKAGDKAKLVDLPLEENRRPADEIERLGSAFKEMAERIQDQMEELRKSDALRRELIANVSHDLRTPLATLQGYIETLLIKQNSLTEEEQRHYLEITIRHCERLNKLVSELLELAKLDSESILIHCEPFNLGELVQDVIQKFDLRAKEKHIILVANVQEELPFADADIGLIERVLENFIENAINYTPQGGTIRLILTPERENISVQISDTGKGIPKEELSHIFSRFYQLEKSRKGDSGHSGLGLAITKRILELHNRTIEVSSSLGTGTTFIFQLPVFKPA
ncbi:ATP-binding protein [Thermodesulfobacteriota bacterium]